MFKKDFIRLIAEKLNKTQVEAENTLNVILDAIVEVVDKEDLTFKQFGSFKKTIRKARIGVNPRTGEKVSIPEKTKLKFLPSEKVNKDLE